MPDATVTIVELGVEVVESQEDLLLLLFADQLHNRSTCRKTIKKMCGGNFKAIYLPLLESGKIKETGIDIVVVSLTEKGFGAVSDSISILP